MDKRVGAQLFTVRAYTQTLPEFDETIRRIAAIGYKTVQLSAIGPFTAEQVDEVCRRHGVIPVCTHRSWEELCNHTEESIRFHQKIGCDIAGVGALPGLRQGISWEELERFVADMNRVNRAFREKGISLAYHNHDVEFSRINGICPMEYMLEKGEFDLIVDVYWLACSGIDPARFIQRVGSRAKVIHFKDLAVPLLGKAQRTAEVMRGNLDWDSILDAGEKAGAQWGIVEQDVCDGDPFDSLKISYDNLLTKGFC